MTVRQVPDRWRVAFSLAGEQRGLVRAVAEEVERQLGVATVFYDEWFEHYIAGADADLRLQDIYGRRCTLVVVCVSGEYEDKPWTQAEHRAIRARQMEAAKSPESHGELAILPLRVGDGEVKGILFNTIAPDIRARTIAEAAALVVDRLRLVEPTSAAPTPPALDWLEHPPVISWPMADHTDVRNAFERLLLRSSPSRILLVRGPSESGKSHITRQMLGNALRINELACGRFDFKGTTDMDAELRSFVQQLEVPFPPAAAPLNERLSQVLDQLRKRGRPALLIFDTYEQAGDGQDWMERQLLPSVLRASWLRVVVGGQCVPDRSGAIWEADAFPTITLTPPPAADWLAYGQQHRRGLTLELVEAFCQFSSNRASVMYSLCGPKKD